MSSMTKQHFKCIADAVAGERREDWQDAKAALDGLARTLAHRLTQFNRNFDKARFLAACGVED